jgi:NAD(P)H-quinone oxidoreductase subunit 5
MMLVVVSIIGSVVARYSLRYLQGNPRQGVFLDRLLTTFAAVQILIVAGDLVLFFAAWLAVSLSLHGLLIFFPERPEARMCARKKFVISRLGDLALVVAIGVTLWAAGTTSFTALSVRPELFASTSLQIVAILLVIGALTKSAQFPFHSWLPESLETPTPVSAFMHAGVINAGGYLILRMSWLIAEAPVALAILAIIGGLTAVLGMSAMVTQTSIKKRLAYSTIGQMGFMTMQCGLGYFHLAFVHMVAHAFYKAYAFLRSGSAIDQRREAAFYPVRTAWTTASSALTCAAVAILLVVAGGVGNPLALVATFAGCTALVHGARDRDNRLAGIGVAALVVVAIVALSYLVTSALPSPTVVPVAAGSMGPAAVHVFLAVLLTGAFVLQVFSTPLSETRLGRRAFIHLHNGLYVGAFFNRALERLIGTSKEK